jgi:hypothetical protein
LQFTYCPYYNSSYNHLHKWFACLAHSPHTQHSVIYYKTHHKLSFSSFSTLVLTAQQLIIFQHSWSTLYKSVNTFALIIQCILAKVLISSHDWYYYYYNSQRLELVLSATFTILVIPMLQLVVPLHEASHYSSYCEHPTHTNHYTCITRHIAVFETTNTVNFKHQ